MKMKNFGRLGFAAAIALGANVALAQTPPPGYPADYAQTIAAGIKEGKLVLYSATDYKAAAPLTQAFEKMYPGIKVEYNDMNSTEVYNRFISEMAAGQGGADVLWSSAMELQMKLVADGYAETYKSPEIAHVPDWAVWKDQAYGTTFEPVVFVYNKNLLKTDLPQTHAEFAKLMATQAAKFQHKVTMYDIEKAGVGFMFATHDLHDNPHFWDLIKDLGKAGVVQQSSTSTMLERIGSGENLLGYNIIGSYALARAKKNPALGVIFPKDYMLVLSRVMFISKKAPHPNASKLWTDFVLSKAGQQVISDQCQLFAMRPDITGETTAAMLEKEVGKALKPIAVRPDLLTYLDRTKRLAFLKEWHQALAK